jgi:hypothetical protein
MLKPKTNDTTFQRLVARLILLPVVLSLTFVVAFGAQNAYSDVLPPKPKPKPPPQPPQEYSIIIPGDVSQNLPSRVALE